MMCNVYFGLSTKVSTAAFSTAGLEKGNTIASPVLHAEN